MIELDVHGVDEQLCVSPRRPDGRCDIEVEPIHVGLREGQTGHRVLVSLECHIRDIPCWCRGHQSRIAFSKVELQRGRPVTGRSRVNDDRQLIDKEEWERIGELPAHRWRRRVDVRAQVWVYRAESSPTAVTRTAPVVSSVQVFVDGAKNRRRSGRTAKPLAVDVVVGGRSI